MWWHDSDIFIITSFINRYIMVMVATVSCSKTICRAFGGITKVTSPPPPEKPYYYQTSIPHNT